MRVAQTGVQILFAFLLALAFQARFADITGFQRAVYVVTLMLCAAATALLIAPAWFTIWWFVLPLRSRARELDMDDHAPDGDQPAALR